MRFKAGHPQYSTFYQLFRISYLRTSWYKKVTLSLPFLAEGRKWICHVKWTLPVPGGRETGVCVYNGVFLPFQAKALTEREESPYVQLDFKSQKDR